MPGIIGMQDSLYYVARPNLAPDRGFESPGLSLPISFPAPRLYLADGVATMRAAGGGFSPWVAVRHDNTTSGQFIRIANLNASSAWRFISSQGNLKS